MEMKNNEWNVPSDYFEKNKKALMPVRKMSNRNWLLALAAACFVGIGLFMWKGKTETKEFAIVQEIGEDKNGEEKVREGKIGEDKRGEEEVREGKIKEDKRGEEKVREGKIKEDKRGEEKVREGKSKEEVAQELKEIPREELVAYLLEQDSELIENLN
jgi:uncharacterized low-complexity protein